MTFKDIMTTVGSAVAVTTILVVGIKANELYHSTANTIDKANKVVDTFYKHDGDIDNALNWVSKLPKTSSPNPVDLLKKPDTKK